MNKAMMIILAVVGIVIYALLNVIIRRMVAGVRSREDYDSDVDGVMTEAEKQASLEQKSLEKEKRTIGIRPVMEEYGARFYVVAAIGAALGGLVGYFYGASLETAVFFVFFAVLTVIAFVDMDTMEIPPVLNLIILGLGLLDIFINPEITLIQRLIGLVCISGFMLILTLLVSGAFGGGDIKLMAAAGVLLGWKGVVTGFMFGLFLGAAIGIVLILRRKKGGKEHMPFGPSLCIGLVAAVLFGSRLIDWYIEIIKLAMPNTYPQ